MPNKHYSLKVVCLTKQLNNFAAVGEMLPNILSQLGPESLDNLKWLASTLSKSSEGDASKSVPAGAAEDDEEMPGMLVVLKIIQKATEQ